MFKKTVLIICGSFVILAGYFTYIKIRSLDYPDDGPRLAIRWEGFYHDYNIRDVGISLNECLRKAVFNEGLLVRSAGWFSGWSCDSIGNPDIIFSLNHSPKKPERFFCQGDGFKTIGRFNNPNIKLSDLEFPVTWAREEVRQPVCRFVKDILQAIADRKKSLVHCDAGRDRTGAVSALITALVAEEVGILDQQLVDAIECDYRKTESLKPEKYGRMRDFIEYMRSQGGIRHFLQNKCTLEPTLVTIAADRMLQ